MSTVKLPQVFRWGMGEGPQFPTTNLRNMPHQQLGVVHASLDRHSVMLVFQCSMQGDPKVPSQAAAASQHASACPKEDTPWHSGLKTSMAVSAGRLSHSMGAVGMSRLGPQNLAQLARDHQLAVPVSSLAALLRMTVDAQHKGDVEAASSQAGGSGPPDSTTAALRKNVSSIRQAPSLPASAGLPRGSSMVAAALSDVASALATLGIPGITSDGAIMRPGGTAAPPIELEQVQHTQTSAVCTTDITITACC